MPKVTFLVACLLCAVFASDVEAQCSWQVTPNISTPHDDSDDDSGTSWPSMWAWSYHLYANQFWIHGNMASLCLWCSTSLNKSGTGNGTYSVQRLTACSLPIEDIEAYGRHEFKAQAHLDAHNSVQGMGLLKWHGGNCSILLDKAKGGVALSSTALEEGKTSGTLEVEYGGVTIGVSWAMGGGDDISATYSDVGQGQGGKSICVFTGHTEVSNDVNISDGNGFADNGNVQLTNCKYEFKIWGTCNGTCQLVILVLHETYGY